MKAPVIAGIPKCPTGIEGLDEITRGGIPRGRATLLAGGPGSGKTLLALQTLVNGARTWREPGIFVAFEESSHRIAANVASFGWDLPALQRKQLFFLDARHKPDLAQAGEFDLAGMLAVVGAKARAMGARRIVFDSVDVLLALLDDPRAERRELIRLNEWLAEEGLTALITGKVFGEPGVSTDRQSPGFMQFLVDCALLLDHQMIEGISQRSLRVHKYRGSGFTESECPLIVGERGLEVAAARARPAAAKVTTERISSGVERLDRMLGGGYFRASSVLITGSPGTAKSTLCGAFCAAACARGERTLFVSYDSDPAEIVRNLSSVGLPLGTFQRRGLLRLISERRGVSSAETQFMQIKAQVREHRARNLVIDPVSALGKQGNELTAHSVIERLTDWTKSEGITLVCTSLLNNAHPETESTPIQVSTIADVWIHLRYNLQQGERNRGLTIVKARGTAHSNQVREMVLSSAGITLEDVYTAGGEVLMGTLRWEKEEAARQAERQKQLEAQSMLRNLQAAEAELAERMEAAGRDLAAKRQELASFRESELKASAARASRQASAGQMRKADPALGAPRKSRKP